MQGAILNCSCVINIVDAHGHTLCSAILRGKNIFNIFDLEGANSIIGDGGTTLRILVAHCLARQNRGKVNRVGREGEMFFCYHRVNIPQGRGNVKG